MKTKNVFSSVLFFLALIFIILLITNNFVYENRGKFILILGGLVLIGIGTECIKSRRFNFYINPRKKKIEITGKKAKFVGIFSFFLGFIFLVLSSFLWFIHFCR